MAKIIHFPMSLDMTRRVNKNKSYERAVLFAEMMKQSEETHIKSQKILKDAEKFQMDINKLFKSEK